MITQPKSLREVKAVSAASRGDRLWPHRSSRIYWHLTQLRERMQRVIDAYFQDVRNGVLIDFGCGNMPYRSLFEPYVENYIGCDFPGNELASVFLHGDGRLPMDDESADIVLSSQVLEHVADPIRYLQEAFRVLRASGLLILSTHGVWRYHPDPTDYWRWTCDGLRMEIERVGFDILDFKGVMGPEATALQLWQDAVLPRIRTNFRGLFTRYAQWRIQRADERCPAEMRDRDACVYVVVAKKLK
jgi:SAM-dependent methyltransferase